MNVLIVAKTRMVGRLCIGGIAATGAPVRLLGANGGYPALNTPYNVGEIWDLTYHAAPNLVAPHVEDVHVTGRQLVGPQANLAAHLRGRVQPWAGGPHAIFAGALGFTGNFRGYIEGTVPANSTGFWLPDADLQHHVDDRHRVFYRYWNGGVIADIGFVGTHPPVQTIPAGTLVRLSLAKWWSPDPGNFPERCYLQLSGWYA